MNTILLTYKGVGLYKDREGKMWGDSKNNDEIQRSRQIKTDLNLDGYMEKHQDVKFMVNYGQMDIQIVEEEATPVSPQTDKEPIIGEPVIEVKEDKAPAGGMVFNLNK